MLCFFFFKQKTAYEMRISDWSSDVCSSDLCGCSRWCEAGSLHKPLLFRGTARLGRFRPGRSGVVLASLRTVARHHPNPSSSNRSEEHTSELQSLMRISYAVFCLKKKNKKIPNNNKPKLTPIRTPHTDKPISTTALI